MESAKKETLDMIHKLPNESTYEDIQYHLYVLEKTSRGEKRLASEGEISKIDAEKHLSQWNIK